MRIIEKRTHSVQHQRMRRFIVYMLVLGILYSLVQAFIAERAGAPVLPSTQSSSSSVSAVTSSAISDACETVTLVFYSKSDFENAEFLHPVSVERCISKSGTMAHLVLKQLFAGPTADEKKKGALGSADLQALGSFYLGVSVEKGIGTINFKKEALSILNSAAARQMMAKSPIEETLKRLSGVKEVNYAIDGKVFVEWDA
jgi:hypothetical protein